MLRFITAGESHGKAAIAILEGLPAGLEVDLLYINAELKRRQGGYGRGGRMEIEQDVVEFLSGIRRGKTIGSPLVMAVWNRDQRLDKTPPLTRMRPGHADLAGCLKYATKDARNVLERASARDTAARVAAGALCSIFLQSFGIRLFGHTRSIGPVAVGGLEVGEDFAAAQTRRDGSPFYTVDNSRDDEMKSAVDGAKTDGDTLGGEIEVVGEGIPPGLGSHTQWDRKLDGLLAQACISVPAVKAVEIGSGVKAAQLPGSQVHDPITVGEPCNPNFPLHLTRPTNNAGGLEGGITNGQRLVIRASLKPIATLMNPLATVDLSNGKVAKASTERSDVCAVPAAGVVLQNAVAIPLTAAFLEKFGGDTMDETRRNFEGYLASLKGLLG